MNPACHHSFAINCGAQKPVHWRLLALAIAFFWLVCVALADAIAAGTSSVDEFTKALGGTREGERYNAIASLARSGQIRSPLSGTDGAAILEGTTQGSRAASIGELAPLFKPDLSGQDAEAILGPEATLSEGNRYNAITSLARAKRFGPSLGEDAALALNGATQGSRAAAIGEIAPYLRANLSGQSIATILGNNVVLTDGNRYNAIAVLARAGKIRGSLSNDEIMLIVQGTTGQTRDSAIAIITEATNRKPASQQASTAGAPTSTAATNSFCEAPHVAIDKPAPTCAERWKTAIFRQGAGKVFFATNQYIDALQESADTGARLADALISVFNLAMFARDVMKLPDGAKQAAVILTKGNSMLLMLGFQNPEQTLGLEVAGEAVGTMRSEIEAMVDAGLGSPPSVMSVAADVANLTNSLLAYANTVRYSRMRNGNTLALEYLRRLYRSGGDQTEFARSLGLAPTASVQDCIRAVNKSAFGFPTLEIDANSYDPSLVEKLVDHWTGAISEYAALKAQ